MIFLLISSNANAFDKNIFYLSGFDSKENILQKIGNSKDVKIQSLPESGFSLLFLTPQEFKFEENSLYEKIETSKTRDIRNQKLILADPKSGRIFYFNYDLKIVKLDLIKPWETKSKLKNIKTILEEMKSSKLEKGE